MDTISATPSISTAFQSMLQRSCFVGGLKQRILMKFAYFSRSAESEAKCFCAAQAETTSMEDPDVAAEIELLLLIRVALLAFFTSEDAASCAATCAEGESTRMLGKRSNSS